MSDLKVIMEEFKALLAKHDLCGLVVLSSPENVEFFLGVEASWTCARLEARMEDGTIGVRVRCKRENFPSREAQKKCLEDTLGSFLGIADTMELNVDQMRGLAQCVIKAGGMELEHRTRKLP